MRSGDVIQVRAQKSDGTVYRQWHAQVESVNDESIVTINRAGDLVGGPKGGWTMKHATRTIYWFNRSYNLAELYQPDGRLKQIYVHIATPAILDDAGLCYTDLELDVVNRPGQWLRIVDEDEFCAAAEVYGYTYEFQCSCREAATEALALASEWCCAGAPLPARRSAPSRRCRGRRKRRHSMRTETPATDSSTLSTDV
ncbi:MAG: DUF402 domain-containing protein [Chloroflexota bacterium]